VTATLTETRKAPEQDLSWYERHPVSGLVLAMVLFGVGGLVVSALVSCCAIFAVALG
jgi:hypothetical protein